MAFAKQNSWVRLLSFWSVARDVNNPSGPLYISTQIQQADLAFSRIFAGIETKATTPSPSPTPAKPTPVPAGSGSLYNWPSKVFAPYVDAIAQPTFNIYQMSSKVGTARYTLAFIVAGADGKPSWGGYIPLSSNLYFTQISSIRQFGGEPIVSFGGASGQELALTTASAVQLKSFYQQVVDAYSLTYLDFDIEGSALSNKPSVDRRNQALRSLQAAQPSLKISYTLPVTTNGLTSDGLYLLQSAINSGVRVDVVNVLAMDFSSAAAPNGDTQMGAYAIQAATYTYAQIQQLGLVGTTVGITVMIGQNNVKSQVFRVADAKQVVTWAKKQTWVSFLSFWSVNRDNAKKSTDLTISTNVVQSDFDYSKAFLQYEN